MANINWICRELVREKDRNLSVWGSEGYFDIRVAREYSDWLGRWEHRGFALTPRQVIEFTHALMNGKKWERVVLSDNHVFRCRVRLRADRVLMVARSSSGGPYYSMADYDAIHVSLKDVRKELVGLCCQFVANRWVKRETVVEREVQLMLTDGDRKRMKVGA